MSSRLTAPAFDDFFVAFFIGFVAFACHPLNETKRRLLQVNNLILFGLRFEESFTTAVLGGRPMCLEPMYKNSLFEVYFILAFNFVI